MTKPKPDLRAKRHDALTGAAQALLDAETAGRDAETTHLKKPRLAKAIEIEPEKSKRAALVRRRDRGGVEEGELAMAPKGMNAWRNEITHVLYGIHRETFKVQSASLSRAGVLSIGSVDARVATHLVMRGRDPRKEALSVFHLFEVAMLPVELCGWESTSVKELEKKAEEMRLAAN